MQNVLAHVNVIIFYCSVEGNDMAMGMQQMTAKAESHSFVVQVRILFIPLLII